MTQQQAVKKNWCFRTGSILFFLGLIFPVFIPLVLLIDMSAKWKTAVTGVMAFGIPELLWVAAAAVLGKEGFDAIKNRVFGYLKKIKPEQEVGKNRYRIGLVMFCLPLLFGWLEPYVSNFLPGYQSYRLVYTLSGDMLFFASFFVLGGNFWDKLQSLFLHGAKVIPSVPKE
jgi:hypothetical protein